MAKRVLHRVFIIVISLSIALVLNVFSFVNKFAEVTPKRLDINGEHAYSRPRGSQVSGFKDSNAMYHRSPCPALNVLANHGYLPRDGKEVTPQVLQQALVNVYNLDTSLAEFLVSTLPVQFSLADLGVHNYVEHDASLVHDDSWTGGDPSSVNTTLATSLLSRANKDQHLTKMTLAAYRREREAFSAANTPDFEETFTAQRELTSYSEAAVLLLVMGEYSTTSVSADHARTFLVEERIPDDYRKPPVPITLFQTLWVMLQMKMFALLSPVIA
ncbi:Chloroperoxidase [Phytophthora megakarya]|uniref:Chloroperoxidase n=1 Tax=Phytophthora megakarya TaxID=4795 RepID=A0A225VRP9_9STRA|nr:Chloroperoxidase [Phytophthora megakarya]